MPTFWIGVMSGTSLDGIDAVRCRFESGAWHSVDAVSRQAWPESLRNALLELQLGRSRVTAAEWAALDQAVSECYLTAILPLCQREAPISGIGLHGQTVFHDGERLMTSLQLGNPHWIAAKTGCLVVHDFRRADMALGGQGAPLVPAFHQALFTHPDEPRGVVNIGGISNLTRLAPGSTLVGYDIGPGNALMDEWMQICRGEPFDAEGRWALTGQVIDTFVEAALAQEWFSRPPPKSTGRDYFSLEWLDPITPGWRQYPAADVQRSLLEITARSIANDTATCRQLIVCGGGALNTALMARLSALLPHAQVTTTAEHGLDPQDVEAAAFAWLAQRRHAEMTAAWHEATGANRAATLGCISLPPPSAHQ